MKKIAEGDWITDWLPAHKFTFKPRVTVDVLTLIWPLHAKRMCFRRLSRTKLIHNFPKITHMQLKSTIKSQSLLHYLQEIRLNQLLLNYMYCKCVKYISLADISLPIVLSFRNCKTFRTAVFKCYNKSTANLRQVENFIIKKKLICDESQKWSSEFIGHRVV